MIDKILKSANFDQLPNVETIRLTKSQFICPGLIDLHIHASQYPNQGLGYDKTLLGWLENYTWPLEARYKDVNFAESVYKRVVRSTLNSGTTTACYYGTIHGESTTKLGQIIHQVGQRALVGKVNMNQNSNSSYIETTAESIKETNNFIKNIVALDSNLVEPAITPRFAISCDNELQKELAKIASENNLYIQTILAHGVHLTGEELEIISVKKSSIAHCPNSNTVLGSGFCRVRDLWEKGINVGLGTDVAGGCSLSIIDAMRSALTTAMHISFNDPGYEPLNFQEVFYMATLGGAKALRKDNIGNLEEGKDFDALIIDMDCEELYYSDMTSIELIQKFIYCGDDRNVKNVYVRGKLVK